MGVLGLQYECAMGVLGLWYGCAMITPSPGWQAPPYHPPRRLLQQQPGPHCGYSLRQPRVQPDAHHPLRGSRLHALSLHG
eukprot:9504017-Pyramimonas_sp.AAC.3